MGAQLMAPARAAVGATLRATGGARREVFEDIVFFFSCASPLSVFCLLWVGVVVGLGSGLACGNSASVFGRLTPSFCCVTEAKKFGRRGRPAGMPSYIEWYVSGEYEVMRLTPYRGVKAFGAPFGPRLSAAQLLGRAPLPNGRRFVDVRDVQKYPQAEPVYNATYYGGVEAERGRNQRGY